MKADLVNQVEKAVKSVTASLDSVVHDAQTYVEAERRLASDARTAAEAAVAAELAHLRAQNDRLAHLLEAERSKSERARDTLTEKIAALIGDYAAERESSVRDGLTEVEEANVAAEAALSKFRTSHGEYMDDALSKGKQFGSILDKKSVDLKRTRDGAFKVCHLVASLSPTYSPNSRH
jgi:kinesin family protein 11